MYRIATILAASLLLLVNVAARPTSDVKGPDIGYVYPAGGQAGTTVEVLLGGYDWTPDMEFHIHHAGLKLQPTGAPGPIIVPEPPYWFGAKANNLPQLPLPREMPAKITIPKDCPPGPIYWQVSNANGASNLWHFIVGAHPEVVEVESRTEPQVLPVLPVTVNGRLVKIEDIDRYKFKAAKDGLVTLSLAARRLGAGIYALVEVRDASGRIIADCYDTEGLDPELTFVAKAGSDYEISIKDVDFRGDRSYAYRLTLTAGPRVVAAIPAAGQRGQKQQIEFVGYGIASGKNQLESVKQEVMFPADPAATFDYALQTPHGTAPAFRLLVADQVDASAPQDAGPPLLTLPTALTAVMDRRGAEHLYKFMGKKGDLWRLTAQAREIGSELDPAIMVRSAEGKELGRADDTPGTPDCTLDFTVPLDGEYTVAIADLSGKTGSRAATYRLVAQQIQPGFSISVAAQRLSIQIGETAELAVKATRIGGFSDPINVSITGLPAGVTTEGELVIPAKKLDLKIQLKCAADCACAAAKAEIRAKAKIGDREVEAAASAPIACNLVARSSAESTAPFVMVAAILQPVCKVEPLEKDGGRIVNRGSTFPAPIIIERYNGFTGDIVMQMSSVQSRHRQGITGGEVVVKDGVVRTEYGCFMPEWLETDRTSRMAVIGVSKVKDPKGNERYAVAGVQGQITMTVEGALLKLAHTTHELQSIAGQEIAIPVKLSRSPRLKDPARLELILSDKQTGQFTAEPMTLGPTQTEAVFRIQPSPTNDLTGRHKLTLRATSLQDGRWPCVSETHVPIEFVK